MTSFLRNRFLRIAGPAIGLAASSVAFAGTYTSPGGAMGDGSGGNGGTPVIVPFVVTDLGNVVSVDITLTGLVHSWAGDVVATLSGPGGAPQPFIMRKAGSSTTNGVGDSSDFNGTYRFIDGGADPVAALVALGSTAALPSGDYFAYQLGLNTTTGNPVSLNTTFGGIAAAGNWTLTVTDTAGGDTGSFTSATLHVVTSGGAVPEPATISAIGLAGVGLMARRRR